MKAEVRGLARATTTVVMTAVVLKAAVAAADGVDGSSGYGDCDCSREASKTTAVTVMVVGEKQYILGKG